MGLEVAILFERLLPESLSPLLGQALAGLLTPVGDGGLHRVCASGRFTGRQTADLLTFCTNQALDGALVIADADDVRVLMFRQGNVVAATSTVLFERLGRILYREDLLGREDMVQLVEVEEKQGQASAVAMLPEDAARWAAERRIWEIAATLCFARRAHFIIVEGTPRLGGLPTFEISTTQLAMEGVRAYDEWRNGPSRSKAARPAETAAEVPAEPAPESAASLDEVDVDVEPLRVIESDARKREREAAERVLRKIRDAASAAASQEADFLDRA